MDKSYKYDFRVFVVGFASLVVLGCGSSQGSDKAVSGTSTDTVASAGAESTHHAADERVRVVRVPRGGVVPDAEVDELGVIHLVYFTNGDVFYVKSPDMGESFSKPIRVNSEPGFASGGAHRGPDLAVGKEGTIHVVWYNAGYQQKRPEDSGVMYSRLSPGSAAFEPTRNLNKKPSDNYSLAADDRGNVAVIWMAAGVFATVSHDGGESFLPAVDLKTDPCECCASRAVYADSTLSVLYRDKADNDRDTYLAVLPIDAPQFTHVKVSQAVWHIDACPMTGSFLNTTNNGLIAGWQTMGQIYFSRLDQRGQMMSTAEIRVAQPGRYPVAMNAPDGVTVVGWKNGTTLLWQLFDANDQPIGSRGSAVVAAGDRPAGVVAIDGTFLLFP